MRPTKVPSILTASILAIAGAAAVAARTLSGGPSSTGDTLAQLPYAASKALGVSPSAVVPFVNSIAIALIIAACALYATSLQKTSFGGVIAALFAASSPALFTECSRESALPLLTALFLLSSYFAVRGRKNIKTEIMSNVKRRKTGVHPLVSPPSGRSAIAGRTTISAAFFSPELAASLAFAFAASLVSIYGAVICIANAIYIISYKGSWPRRAARAIVYGAVSLIPVISAMLYNLVRHSSLATLSDAPSSGMSGALAALAKGFSSFYAPSGSGITVLSASVLLAAVLGVSALLSAYSLIFGGRGFSSIGSSYDGSGAGDKIKIGHFEVFAMFALISATHIAFVAFAPVKPQVDSLERLMLPIFVMLLLVASIIMDAGLSALVSAGRDKARLSKHKSVIKISMAARKTIVFMALLILALLPNMIQIIKMATERI